MRPPVFAAPTLQTARKKKVSARSTRHAPVAKKIIKPTARYTARTRYQKPPGQDRAKVRAPIADARRGRVSTTRFKTTDAVKRLNGFLRNAGLYTTLRRFEGGHLIADRYGGPTSKTNVVPLPHSTNTINYKKMETAVAALLRAHPAIVFTMQVRAIFPDDPLLGVLDVAEQRTVAASVNAGQFAKLQALYRDIPDEIYLRYTDPANVAQSQQMEVTNIRRDVWPKVGGRIDKPAGLATNAAFLAAINRL
jgi:hypothetical protein